MKTAMKTLNQRQIKKIQSREKIIAAASKLFRTEGISRTGVDAVMKEAGLTAGAFYAHFSSKEELILEATRTSVAEKFSKMKSRFTGKWGEEFLRYYLQLYLSEIHRDRPELGCAMAAYGTELKVKKGQKVASGWDEQLQGMIDDLATAFVGKNKREKAIQFFSHAMGTMIIARAVKDESFSREILRAGKKFLDT